MADVIICEPSTGCKDPHPNRWYCMRGHSLDGEPKKADVCPLDVCIKRGANATSEATS